jgi:polysaccharide export outer membrane protein
VPTRTPRHLLPGLALLCALGCGAAGPHTRFQDLARSEWEAPSGQYLIGVGDALAVLVYEQPGLATRARVRTDGRIALPFIGEAIAVGKAPTALAQEIETRLKQFILNPRVTVNVEESPPLTVSVIGEVRSVGQVTLEPGGGVLQALAQAGGPSEFADRSAIYVLRRVPEPRRIRFHFAELTENRGGAASFPLRRGDVVIVE